MEWLRKLLEGATIADGKLDIEALMTSINTEFPKNAVPKDKYNDISGELKTANATIKDLKKNNSDNETLQNTIKEHETTIATLKADSTKREKEYSVKGALEKAGATDIEYLLYKLGGVDKLEVDSEGKIKDLDNKIKDLQATNATFFKTIESNENKPKVIENKLPGGEQTKSFTKDEVAKMSPQEINANWDVIKTIDLSK
ncbi:MULTISPECIES: phage scaffolding protein [unclassified Clostridium]|uniref:phage scaffolding protein n=1 Tax=unclassified Clostridium TaxID=2614128 RepID=UPI001EEEEE4A|nr:MULTISPECIES: phage scaffolding protein [unclassified Clostridium]